MAAVEWQMGGGWSGIISHRPTNSSACSLLTPAALGRFGASQQTKVVTGVVCLVIGLALTAALTTSCVCICRHACIPQQQRPTWVRQAGDRLPHSWETVAWGP